MNPELRKQLDEMYDWCNAFLDELEAQDPRLKVMFAEQRAENARRLQAIKTKEAALEIAELNDMMKGK